MALVPVCNMEVDETGNPPKTEFDGQTYFFCAEGCKKAFEAEPSRYVPKTADGSES